MTLAEASDFMHTSRWAWTFEPKPAMHKLPSDFRKAIDSDAAAKSLWADITPLARNEWICWVASAKKEETRKRRIEVGLDKMRGGMRRPCCWPGCPHR
jgi:uncharacterized protein YdeI (YjbR/CyaY-like superfamily)